MTCGTQIRQVHKAELMWAQDHQDRFPLASVISPATARKSSQQGDSTANLFSILIYNNYITPQVVVCVQETNSAVEENTNYDYGSYPGNTSTGLSPSDAWDYDFSCDITGAEKSARTGQWRSNISYANLASSGSRQSKLTYSSNDPNFPILADRGPRNGFPRSGSQSLSNHGNTAGWAGNIVFADNHVQLVKERKTPALAFVLPGMEKSTNGKPDNIFAEDDPDTGSDIYLSVWGDCIDGNLQALWD